MVHNGRVAAFQAPLSLCGPLLPPRVLPAAGKAGGGRGRTGGLPRPLRHPSGGPAAGGDSSRATAQGVAVGAGAAALGQDLWAGSGQQPSPADLRPHHRRPISPAAPQASWRLWGRLVSGHTEESGRNWDGMWRSGWEETCGLDGLPTTLQDSPARDGRGQLPISSPSLLWHWADLEVQR